MRSSSRLHKKKMMGKEFSARENRIRKEDIEMELATFQSLEEQLLRTEQEEDNQLMDEEELENIPPVLMPPIQGIVNKGSTCYITASLVSLFHSPHFVLYIRIIEKTDEDHYECSLCLLVEFFHQ